MTMAVAGCARNPAEQPCTRHVKRLRPHQSDDRSIGATLEDSAAAAESTHTGAQSRKSLAMHDFRRQASIDASHHTNEAAPPTRPFNTIQSVC